MSEQSESKILFFDTALFDDGAAIRGGVLVTDMDTKPCEFRCTSSVKPTSLQRVLYGDTLEEYVHVELIGAPLVKAAKEAPNLVVVRNPVLLRIRPLIAYPVVLIRRDQKLAADVGGGGVAPVTLSAHRDFASESVAAQTLLASLMQQRDLMEPFERLRIALTEAHKQHVGDNPAGAARA